MLFDLLMVLIGLVVVFLLSALITFVLKGKNYNIGNTYSDRGEWLARRSIDYFNNPIVKAIEKLEKKP